MAADEVRRASEQFYAALNRMFSGEMGPMEAVWSHAEDVTNMGPFGERQVGWEAVRAELSREADMRLDGNIVAEDMLACQVGDFGYTVGIERGEDTYAGSMPITINHRATNIFRRENDEWKLVHHHTDQATALQEMTWNEQE